MVRLQIASDLHIEYLLGKGNDWDSHGLINPSAPNLALLGDIGLATQPALREQYQSFIEWCCSKFEKVLLLTGNHEYYNQGRRDVVTKGEVDQWLQEELAPLFGNLHVMLKGSIVIDGTLVLGTTLWSQIPNEIAKKQVESFLNE